MIELETEVRIECRRQNVFDVLSDFETYLARWAKGPIEARRIEGDGTAGTRYSVTARVGPLKVRSPYEVTDFEAPVRLAGHGDAGPVRFDEEYVLSEDRGGTLLRQSIRARPRGPFGIVEGLIRRQLKGLIAADLQRLKALVESSG